MTGQLIIFRAYFHPSTLNLKKSRKSTKKNLALLHRRTANDQMIQSLLEAFTACTHITNVMNVHTKSRLSSLTNCIWIGGFRGGQGVRLQVS